MATIDIYDKGQVDSLLSGKANAADLPSASELVPDYSGASADDVLTIENGAPVWKAASGGGGSTIQTFTINSLADLRTAISDLKIGDRIIELSIENSSEGKTKLRDHVIYDRDETNIFSSGMISTYRNAYYFSSGFETHFYLNPQATYTISAKEMKYANQYVTLETGTIYFGQQGITVTGRLIVQKFS